jgi:murein L,D-transpeptidase YcbB/YkuD
VEAFQRDYGLNDDGVVGAMTLAAINAPVETRLSQVVVNLERLRWMNRDLGERYLLVNIPDFTVTLYDDGQAVWNSKVVVGKTNVTETPEFDGVVRTMVVNPTWHIPDSIAIRDYLPALKRDPMVLKRQNIRLLTRGGTEINPKLVDFTQYTPENFPFRIKQRPNDDNALGEVKFLFPNEFSVYMHDTPHRELFARDVRAFSNGCIRLQKPVELAHIVLTGQVADPDAAYAKLRATGKERAIALKRPIPVHVVYRTVWFDDAGTARYRPDVYGRDAEVFRALEAAGVTLPAAQG